MTDESAVDRMARAMKYAQDNPDEVLMLDYTRKRAGGAELRLLAHQYQGLLAVLKPVDEWHDAVEVYKLAKQFVEHCESDEDVKTALPQPRTDEPTYLEQTA